MVTITASRLFARSSRATFSQATSAAPEEIRVDQLKFVVPRIGSLTGDGTIAPTGELNFRMLAKPSGFHALTSGLVVASLGNGIPVRIQGTATDPSFGPDVGRAVGGIVKGSEAVGRAAGAAMGGAGGQVACVHEP